MAFTLGPLGYAFDALEPYIDAQTMEIHYTKHHQAYVNGLNAALAQYPSYQEKSLISLLQSIETLPPEIQTAVRNHGGGHENHTFFWNIMSPGGAQKPVGSCAAALNKSFGSYDAFVQQFNVTALARFGSGWVWLCVNKQGALELFSTANQDSPLMEGKTPIMGLDVWEHAYYLKYQNRRPEYVTAWWSVLNWEKVEENYEATQR